MQDIVGLVAVAGSISGVVYVLYLLISSRHKVRMALIQHGQQAGIFKEHPDGSSALKYGMVAIGLGLGLFIGSILENAINLPAPLPHFAMMLILGGTGLILYYVLVRKKEESDMID